MRLRTIALAVALACGFTAAGEAKKNVVRPAAKSHHVKRASRGKRAKHAKHHALAKIKHR
jgi:hypothetical protein